MLQSSILFQKPIKQIPDFLFLDKGFAKPNSICKEYMCISTKNPNNYGELVCRKIKNYYRKDYKGYLLGIDFIRSSPTGIGMGKTMINFAKNLSKICGCNGYIILKSDVSFTPNRIPHLFYRKQGFSSSDKKIDKKMDLFIKYKKIATYKDFPCIIMHYPPIKEEHKSTLLSCLKKIKNLFK